MNDQCVTVHCCDVSVCVGEVTVISDVTFECCQGEWVVLAGPSGAGKTTLLRAINGLCPPTGGRVWALGTWMPGRTPREAQRAWRRTGTVQQDLALFESVTAVDNVAIGLRGTGQSGAEIRRQARSWLERLGLEDKAGTYPRSLSGGERQRVAIARALAPQPQLLILDEPTAHLDDGAARVVLTAVKELVQLGSTVVMASHREDEMASLQTCRIELDEGRVNRICR
jgi:ABC-type methionine transport system ATPase subunit